LPDGYLPADAAARYREVYPDPETHERAKAPPLRELPGSEGTSLDTSQHPQDEGVGDELAPGT
jgi:hypothetical protein